MDEYLLNVILANTYTKTEALRRVRLLKTHLVKFFFGTNDDLTLSRETPEDTKWLSELIPQDIKAITAQNVYQKMDELYKQINTLDPMTLYVPVSLPYANVTMLGKRLRESYGNGFVIEVKLDTTLIAGCALVWHGIYRDYSLRRKIRDNQERILQQFKEYLKR